ncbi:hypothetical protein [Rhodoplanes sp. SY1]|uniref:hypothetical protein n=1 Tax=Rhodoplanes sp. SY1 TaxID=3166646 RepID=UPI0038B552AE
MMLRCGIVSDFRTLSGCASVPAVQRPEETILVYSIDLNRVAIYVVFGFVTAIVLGAF